MPAAFLSVAVRAAAEAGFADYDSDACLARKPMRVFSRWPL
jgi:hypothetical protein